MKPGICHTLFLLLALVALAFGTLGCATTDEPENTSMRPWNAPKSWENGVPMGLGSEHR